MRLEHETFLLRCMGATAPGGPWQLLDLHGSWLRVRLPDLPDAVVVIEHEERGYQAACAYPDGTRRDDLGARLPEAPFVRLYRAPDEPEARLAVVMGTSFGAEVPDEFEPERLVQRVAALMAMTTPGQMTPIAPLNRAAGRGPDVFISYAAEDLDEVARPLAEALRTTHDLDVFLGDVDDGAGVSHSIDAALRSSRASVPILSPHSLVKGWTRREQGAMVEMATDGTHLVFPVWHRVTRQQVVDASPLLASHKALETATTSIAEIAAAIARGLDGRHHSL